jgi:hypothetical protein
MYFSTWINVAGDYFDIAHFLRSLQHNTSLTNLVSVTEYARPFTLMYNLNDNQQKIRAC